MSKNKSVTEGHVSETEQKAINIIKEGYTSQRYRTVGAVQDIKVQFST